MFGLFLILFISTSFSVDFSNLPPAKTVEESKTLLLERFNTVAKFSANIPSGLFTRQNNGRFLATAIARLYLGQNMDEVNRVLEDSNTVAYSKYGTDIVVIPKLCQRTGDYDFSLVDLIRVAYLGKNALSPLAKFRILNELLSAKGDDHYSHFWIGPCGRHKDSENHILMTETSRYLTNQLIKNSYAYHKFKKDYDNAQNKFPAWMTKYLQQFFTKGFEEFNSRPYEGYSIKAIDNLYSYAEDSNVVTTAQSLLDLMSATYAVQSNGLRRLPPWRRQPQYLGHNTVYDGDNGMHRFIMLSGNYHFFPTLEKPFDFPIGEGIVLPAITSPYRVPDFILDLMINNEHKTYFQGLRHMSAELYSSSPSALISSGGTYINNFDFGTKERDGLPNPITIILTKDISTDIRNWFRIEGHKKLKYRNNLCVSRNFACGLNVRIPDYIPETCQEKLGDWTFFNFSSPACNYNYGVHVAVLKKNSNTIKCRAGGDNFGIIEVRESNALSYQDFKSQILSNNLNGINCEGSSSYKTTDGLNINFEFMPKKNYLSPIMGYNGEGIERDYRRWKRAFGDIINSSSDGKIFEITNPSLRQKLTIDVTNPIAPKRFVTSY